jgi:hypothetical protein
MRRKVVADLTESQAKFMSEIDGMEDKSAWLLFVNAGHTMDDARVLHAMGLIDCTIQFCMPAARKRRFGPHIVDGEFQSDKYPTTPRGKVPLSVKDESAQDLLWEYAQRRRKVDAEFANDLEYALLAAGFAPLPAPVKHS